MRNSPLSYVMTSFASHEIDESFLVAKRKFNLFIYQKKTQEENVITKNIAHITMKRMFYLKDGVTEEIVVTALDRIHINPIPITASEPTIFHSEKHGNVLVALVNKTPELQNLHNAISDAIDQYIEINPKYERDGFTPHLSVLYNVPDNQVGEAIAYTKQNILPISYILDNINLLIDVPGIKKERAFVKTYMVSK